MVGDDLQIVAGNRQVCPTMSETTLVHRSSPFTELPAGVQPI